MIALLKSKVAQAVSRFQQLPKKTRLLIGGAAVTVLVLTAGAATFSNNDLSKLANIDTAEQEQLSCPFPRKEFPEYAFSLGIPEKWLYEVDNGTIQITEDESNTTTVFIYTAKLDTDLPSEEFLQDFADVFRQTIEGAGGTFTLGEISNQDNNSSAPAEALVAEGKLAGSFNVEKDAGFVTLKVYWAPEDELAEKEPMLQEIAGCFARTTVLDDQALASAREAAADNENPGGATAFTAHSGQYFKIDLPQGWKVTGETDSGIDTSNADGSAGYSYAYVTGTSSAIEPAAWAQQQLAAAGIAEAKLSNAREIPAQIDGQQIKSFDFTGSLNGRAVKGKTTAGVYNTADLGFGSYGSAFMGIEIAETTVWESVKNLTARMQNSLELLDIGDARRNTMLPPNRPIESTGGDSLISSGEYRDAVNDKSSKGWREATSGYEEVQSPSTGDTYDVPLNAWNSAGPSGPGYYRQLPDGSSEKLNSL